MRHLAELDSIVGSTTTFTVEDAVRLEARSQQLGVTAAEFDWWIARYQIIDEAETDVAPWPAEVRQRVRALLDALSAAIASDDAWMRWAQTRTLWSVLGVRQSVWLDQLRGRARLLAAETVATHHDVATGIRRELLSLAERWLLRDSGPASYVASVALDVNDALTRTARSQVRVNGEVQSAELLELLEAATDAGAALSWDSLQHLIRASVTSPDADGVDQPGDEAGYDRLVAAAHRGSVSRWLDPRLFQVQRDASVRRRIDAGTAWIEQWHYERMQNRLRPANTWDDTTANDAALAGQEPTLADGLVVRTRGGRVLLFAELGELRSYRSRLVADGDRRGLTRRRALTRYSALDESAALWRVYEGIAGTLVPMNRAGWTGFQSTGFARAWNESGQQRRLPDATPTETLSSHGLMSAEQALSFLRGCREEGLEWIGQSAVTRLPELDRRYRPGRSRAPTPEETACIAAYAALGTYRTYKATGGMGISETRMSLISSLNAQVNAALYDGFCFDLRQCDETDASAAGSKASSLLPTRTVVVRAFRDQPAAWPVFDGQPGHHRNQGWSEPEKFLVAMYNGADEARDGSAESGGSLRDCVIVLRTDIERFLVALARPTATWPERPALSRFRFEQRDALNVPQPAPVAASLD